MTQKHDRASQSSTLPRQMILGALIGLVVITFLVSTGAGHARPEWGRFWMIRPLVIVPMAGAVGGLCRFYINNLNFRAKRAKALAWCLGVVVVLFGLWLGVILGLDGTLWN